MSPEGARGRHFRNAGYETCAQGDNWKAGSSYHQSGWYELSENVMSMMRREPLTTELQTEHKKRPITFTDTDNICYLAYQNTFSSTFT